MSTLFDAIKAAIPAAEPKAPAVPLVDLAVCESLEELGEKLEAVKQAKKYVSFRALAVAMGRSGAFRPSAIPVLLHGVAEINPAYQALIVNERGQHAAKVAGTHAETLKAWGYTELPEVKKGKSRPAQATEERETI